MVYITYIKIKYITIYTVHKLPKSTRETYSYYMALGGGHYSQGTVSMVADHSPLLRVNKNIINAGFQTYVGMIIKMHISTSVI